MLLHIFVFACLEIKLRVGWNAALVMMWFQQNWQPWIQLLLNEMSLYTVGMPAKRRLDRGSFKQLWLEIALVHRLESKKAGPIWMESSNWNTIKVQHIPEKSLALPWKRKMLRCQAARRHRLTARNIFGRLPFTNPKLLRWSSILWKANHSEETSKFTLRVLHPFVREFHTHFHWVV